MPDTLYPLYLLMPLRSSKERTIGRIAAVTADICLAGADVTDCIMVQGANLRRNVWTTQTAVFRARALTMAARPRPPNTATATWVGSALVARRVSFTGIQFNAPSTNNPNCNVTFPKPLTRHYSSTSFFFNIQITQSRS